MAPSGYATMLHRARRAHPARFWFAHQAGQIEEATAAQIREMQDRRLRALVRIAASRSPYYRKCFRERGIDPQRFSGVEDLARLPMLGRDDLVASSDRFRTLPRPRVWSARSSGTTGSVITAYRTPSSSVFELVALERQWSWFGVPRSPRRLTLRGSGLRADRAGDVVRELRGSRQLHVSSAHLTAEHLPEILEAARVFEPEVLEGWPSSLAIFARLLHEVGAVLPVRAVITSSETIGAAQRTLFASAFGGPIVDHYGQTERVAMAGNCEMGRYHVFPDYGYVELVPIGEQEWEIVATPLHNSGFILFRYRTGDVVGPEPGESCPCGRKFPLLGALEGRKEDYFVAADGGLVPLPHRLIKNLTGLAEVQVVQLAPGRFEFRVVPGPGFDFSGVQAMVRDTVGHVVGPGQEVTFRRMSRIPRTAGGKLPSAVRLDSSGDRR